LVLDYNQGEKNNQFGNGIFRAGILANYESLDDESLVGLVARGQTEALGTLYDRFGHLVYGVALHICGETNLAEEITQDVFLRAWEHAAAYHANQGKVGSWLAGIARNRAIDIFRHHQTDAGGHSQSWEELPLFDPPDSQDVEQEVATTQQQQRVRLALASLPPDQCQVLALAYFRGLTQEEIAGLLGEPLGTVKTRIRLGMQKLRKFLENEI
jgi:RNA polymerase sigma-70 factor, ECF subfamily